MDRGLFRLSIILSMQWWIADFFPNGKTCSSTSLFFQTLSWKENLPLYTQVIGTAGKVRAGWFLFPLLSDIQALLECLIFCKSEIFQ